MIIERYYSTFRVLKSRFVYVDKKSRPHSSKVNMSEFSVLENHFLENLYENYFSKISNPPYIVMSAVCLINRFNFNRWMICLA